MTEDQEELVAVVQAAFAEHLRAESQTRTDGTAELIEEVADDVESLPLDDERFVRLTAQSTRPGPDGLDTFVIGSGWSRWISRFDPREQPLEQLLDLIIANDTADEARELDEDLP